MVERIETLAIIAAVPEYYLDCSAARRFLLRAVEDLFILLSLPTDNEELYYNVSQYREDGSLTQQAEIARRTRFPRTLTRWDSELWDRWYDLRGFDESATKPDLWPLPLEDLPDLPDDEPLEDVYYLYRACLLADKKGRSPDLPVGPSMASLETDSETSSDDGQSSQSDSDDSQDPEDDAEEVEEDSVTEGQALRLDDQRAAILEVATAALEDLSGSSERFEPQVFDDVSDSTSTDVRRPVLRILVEQTCVTTVTILPRTSTSTVDLERLDVQPSEYEVEARPIPGTPFVDADPAEESDDDEARVPYESVVCKGSFERELAKLLGRKQLGSLPPCSDPPVFMSDVEVILRYYGKLALFNVLLHWRPSNPLGSDGDIRMDLRRHLSAITRVVTRPDSDRTFEDSSVSTLSLQALILSPGSVTESRHTSTCLD